MFIGPGPGPVDSVRKLKPRLVVPIKVQVEGY